MSSSSLAAPPERVSGNGVSKPETESGAESGAEFGAAQADSAAAAAAGVRKQPRLQRLISLPCGTCSWGSLITARCLRKAAALLWHWCCRQQLCHSISPGLHVALVLQAAAMPQYQPWAAQRQFLCEFMAAGFALRPACANLCRTWTVNVMLQSLKSWL